MWIYFALFLMPPAVAGAERLPARARQLAYALCWLALVAFVGLRREVAGDWDNYLLLFQRAREARWLEALTLSDPGYMLLNVFVARLGLGIAGVNVAAAAIFATGLLLFVRRQPLPHLALLAAVPVLIAICGLGITRQSIAAGLLLWALAGYADGSRLRSSLLLAVAPAFHWTGIVLVPLIPLILMKQAPARRTLLLLAAAAGVVIVLLLSLPPLADRAALVGHSAGAWFRAMLTLAAMAAALAWGNRLAMNDAERRSLDYLCALAVFCVLLLFVLSTAGDRIGFYAVALQMMVWPRAVPLLRPGPLRSAAKLAVAAPYLVLFVAWLMLTGYRPCLLPYRNYLGAPRLIWADAPEPPRRSAACQRVQDVD